MRRKFFNMTLTERAAYLKGLADGLALDEAKPEAKLLKEVIAIIEDIANDVTDMAEDIQDIGDYCEELDEDLGDVETDIYECEEDEDEWEDEEDEEPFYEITCPSCGEAVYFDDSLDPSDLLCPACGEHFDCTCDGECGACDCECE